MNRDAAQLRDEIGLREASLRDAMEMAQILEPWDKSHGYHRDVIT